MSRYRHPDEYTPSDLKRRSPSRKDQQTYAEWLAQGNKPQQIPNGVSGEQWNGYSNTVKRQK